MGTIPSLAIKKYMRDAETIVHAVDDSPHFKTGGNGSRFIAMTTADVIPVYAGMNCVTIIHMLIVGKRFGRSMPKAPKMFWAYLYDTRPISVPIRELIPINVAYVDSIFGKGTPEDAEREYREAITNILRIVTAKPK
jgi:hypothetical protein